MSRRTAEELDHYAKRRVDRYNSGGKYLDVMTNTAILGMLSLPLAGAYLGAKIATGFPNKYIEVRSSDRRENVEVEVSEDNIFYKSSPRWPIIKTDLRPGSEYFILPGGIVGGILGAVATEKLFSLAGQEYSGEILTPWAERGLEYINNLF